MPSPAARLPFQVTKFSTEGHTLHQELKHMSKKSAAHNSTAFSANASIDAMTAILEPPVVAQPAAAAAVRKPRSSTPTQAVRHHTALHQDDHAGNRQAEMFYLQKQVQQQTQMVFILEDGSKIQGIIEWYDRNSIKVRGKSRVLIYKTAIKYLYKAGEVGSVPEHRG
jgi:sRNA-binding regulator protein Hfq